MLGWQAKTSFADLVKEMVAADREGVQRSLAIREAGFEVHRNYD